jgi:PBP1b-binding outer membrane lipoprotein LpoB
MKTYIYILILLSSILFYSCKKKNLNNSVKENTYKVLSVLHHDVSRYKMIHFAFQPLPPNPNISWDSIKKAMELDKSIEKDTVKIVDALIKKNGRLIVAIDSVLTPSWADNLKNIKQHEDYEELLKQFISNKDTVNIDVSKITSNKYAFIIPYREDYKYLHRKGYDKFNINLSFSKVEFNKEKNKAIVIMGASFGKLNGFSALYFLEKKNGNWIIKYEKGLSIS